MSRWGYSQTIPGNVHASKGRSVALARLVDTRAMNTLQDGARITGDADGSVGSHL